MLLTASALVLAFGACSSDEETEITSKEETSSLDGAWKAVSEKKTQTDKDGNQTVLWEEACDDNVEISVIIFNTSAKKIIKASIDNEKNSPTWYVSDPKKYVFEEGSGLFYYDGESFRVTEISKNSLTIEKLYEVDDGISKSHFTAYTRIDDPEALIGKPIDFGESNQDVQDMSVVSKNLKENRLLLAWWTSGTINIAFALFPDGTCIIDGANKVFDWSYDADTKLLAITNGMVFTIKSLSADMLVAEYSSGSALSTYTWTPHNYTKDAVSAVNLDMEMFMNGKWKRKDGSILTINDNNFTFTSADGISISGIWYESVFKWKYQTNSDSYAKKYDAAPMPVMCWSYNGENHYYGNQVFEYRYKNSTTPEIEDNYTIMYCCGSKMEIPSEWIETTSAQWNYRVYAYYVREDGVLSGDYTFVE